MPDKPKTLSSLLDTLPQVGEVRWIGVRPAKYEPLISLDVVNAAEGRGLDGDHYASRGGKRQVTLIQMEHMAAIASMLHMEKIEPDLLRRNIAVTGINLLALKGRQFQIGLAVMKYSGPCHPCSNITHSQHA